MICKDDRITGTICRASALPGQKFADASRHATWEDPAKVAEASARAQARAAAKAAAKAAAADPAVPGPCAASGSAGPAVPLAKLAPAVPLLLPLQPCRRQADAEGESGIKLASDLSLDSEVWQGLAVLVPPWGPGGLCSYRQAGCQRPFSQGRALAHPFPRRDGQRSLCSLALNLLGTLQTGRRPCARAPRPQALRHLRPRGGTWF